MKHCDSYQLTSTELAKAIKTALQKRGHDFTADGHSWRVIETLIYVLADLVRLADHELTMEGVIDAIEGLGQFASLDGLRGDANPFAQAIKRARYNVPALHDDWFDRLSNQSLESIQDDPAEYERLRRKYWADCQTLKMVESFFAHTYTLELFEPFRALIETALTDIVVTLAGRGSVAALRVVARCNAIPLLVHLLLHQPCRLN